MDAHINASPEAGKLFYQEYQGKGAIIMLNLLRFRTTADYSKFEALKPEQEISGQEAFQVYMQHTQPLLQEAGGKVLYHGKTNQFLIGPSSEQWDLMLLVRHQSVEKFLAFAQNPAYQKIIGHRTAALEDSRLLPSIEVK